MDNQAGEMTQQPSGRSYDELQEWLALSLDHPLDDEQDRAMTEAMQDIPALQAEKLALIRLRSQLSCWKPPANPDFLAQLMQKIEKKRRDALVLYFFPRVAVASILLAIGISLLSGYFSRHVSDKVALGVDHLEPDDAYGLIASE